MLDGTALACWSTGSVVAEDRAGGLVNLVGGRLGASFSAAAVHATSTEGASWQRGQGGGLAAEVGGSGLIVASYAIGIVRAHRAGSFVGRQNNGATFRANYATGRPFALVLRECDCFAGSFSSGARNFNNWCDWYTTGRGGCIGATFQSTGQLQAPTRADGHYANWDDLT